MNFEWVSITERFPSDEEMKRHDGHFICHCVVGDGEGKMSEFAALLKLVPMPGQRYKWSATDSEIVTHWANLPFFPNEIVLKGEW